MQVNLSGKLALVTGSNTGIGRGIALALAKSGADVAVHYRQNKDQGEAVAEAIRAMGRRSAAFQADLAKVADAERLVAETEREFGRSIDILVNNAGHLIARVKASEITEEYYNKVMDVNLKSCVFVSKAALRGMIAAKSGVIVNMASVAAHNGGGPGGAIYSASKAAVIAYTKGLAKEVAGLGIRVNAVAPGIIGQTLFHDTFTPPDVREAQLKMVPMGREGTPEDVAGAVLFLVSDLASYLTGATIDINGGMFMR
jgi:3-oxoacyl-[acyl-carrier protein] reductase